MGYNLSIGESPVRISSTDNLRSLAIAVRLLSFVHAILNHLHGYINLYCSSTCDTMPAIFTFQARNLLS